MFSHGNINYLYSFGAPLTWYILRVQKSTNYGLKHYGEIQYPIFCPQAYQMPDFFAFHTSASVITQYFHFQKLIFWVATWALRHSTDTFFPLKWTHKYPIVCPKPFFSSGLQL